LPLVLSWFFFFFSAPRPSHLSFRNEDSLYVFRTRPNTLFTTSDSVRGAPLHFVSSDPKSSFLSFSLRSFVLLTASLIQLRQAPTRSFPSLSVLSAFPPFRLSAFPLSSRRLPSPSASDFAKLLSPLLLPTCGQEQGETGRLTRCSRSGGVSSGRLFVQLVDHPSRRSLSPFLFSTPLTPVSGT
jgi:hypothetical protein